jgi:hypothetical protein
MIAEAKYQLDIVFVESSPELTEEFDKFVSSVGKSMASVVKKPPAYELLDIKLTPNMGVEEF